MELISKDGDIHLYTGTVNGCLVRFYADRECRDIYLNVEDAALVMRSRPDPWTRDDFDDLKRTLKEYYNTVKTITH